MILNMLIYLCLCFAQTMQIPGGLSLSVPGNMDCTMPKTELPMLPSPQTCFFAHIPSLGVDFTQLPKPAAGGLLGSVHVLLNVCFVPSS